MGECKLGLFLSVYVDDMQMEGKKPNMVSMWKILQKEFDLEDPTPSVDQMYMECTQREATVDPKAVQFNTEISKS